jgi:hypothetical protein
MRIDGCDNPNKYPVVGLQVVANHFQNAHAITARARIHSQQCSFLGCFCAPFSRHQSYLAAAAHNAARQAREGRGNLPRATQESAQPRTGPSGSVLEP